MSPLHHALEDYLAIRRALGFKLERHGRLLPQFLAYLQEVGADTVTTEHALRWATLPSTSDPGWWAERLAVVRGFARYLQTLDAAAELPPTDLLPAHGCRRRATPCLYSDRDIAALMAAAATLRPPLRAATTQTLIGLLAVTGMRIGEALRLDRGDLDLKHARLIVRESKFGKSRELPLHPTTMRALRAYLRRRDQLLPRPDTPALLISPTGERLRYPAAGRTFRQLVAHVGLTPRSATCRPHAHDMRHSFAVRTVLDAYQTGADAPSAPGVAVHLPRPRRSRRDLLVSVGRPGAARARRRATATARLRGALMSALAPTLQAYFVDRLIAQHASPHTIRAYRDTMRLLLAFAQARLATPAAQLDIADLDADLIAAFLDHVEHERDNTIATRNARLAAIHSLFHFAALRHPEHAGVIERVLAIPPKRHDRALVTYLSDPEIDALLAAPDPSTWIGRL